MGRLLFIIFLLVPIIEIGLFILLGGVIGLWPTLLGVVVTAVIGSVVIRAQGTSLIEEIRKTSAMGGLPAKQLAFGMMIGIAGALLLTPGYFTDTFGFLLLVPKIRSIIYEELKKRISVVATSSTSSSFEASFSNNQNDNYKQDEIEIDEDIIDLDPKDWRDD